MTDAAPFLGTWTSEGVPPRSTFEFTWTIRAGQLHGVMVVQPSDPAVAERALAAGQPDRFDIALEDVELDGRRILFRQHPGSPAPVEFRLLDENHAVVGVAEDHIPDDLRALTSQQSIEGHRVTLTRHAPADPAEG